MNHNPLHDLAMIRRISLYCAAAVLVVSCLMSFKFGWSMSILHAVGLAFITICTALMPPFIGHQWKSGSKAYAVAMMPILVLLGMVEFGTHTGYTNGVRTIETETAGYKNAAYDMKQGTAKRNADLLADLRKELATLKEQNPWAASVSADGLRAQIAPMDEAIRQEERRGGCGPRCLALQKDKAAKLDQIAIIDKADDIGGRIATLQNIVNDKETEATTAEFRSSEVVAQTNIFAKAVAWSLEPTDAEKEGTQIGVGFAMALATTFLPAVFMLMAFGPAEFVPGHTGRVAQATEKVTGEAARMLNEMREMMANARPAPVSAPAIHSPEKHTREVVVVEKGDKRLDDLLEGLSHWADKAPALKAA
jgi:hypothetical protein